MGVGARAGTGVVDAQDQAVWGEAEPEEFVIRVAQKVRRANAQEWAEKLLAAKALATADSDKDDRGGDVNSN